MSREIKFKIWDKTFKKFLKDDYESKNVIDRDGNLFMYVLSETFRDLYFYKLLKNIEISEYTGLKDSKGKEIYEDDIVWNEYDEEYQVIIFDEGEYKLMGESHIQNLFNNLDYIDVRGNVYENLELVKAWYKED
jgi:hypothetical protein